MNTFGWMKAAGLAFAMASATLATSASAQVIGFSGFAQGCFSATACTPTNTATLGGLTYVRSSFSVAAPFVVGGMAGIGNATIGDNLGTFTLSNQVFNYTTAAQNFTLGVTFTLPVGTSPSQQTFNAVLTGNVVANGVGGVNVDFDNTPIAFAFSNAGQSGAFTLKVNDVTLTPGGFAVPVTGLITVTATPGPIAGSGFVALLGLAGVIAFGRGRKSTEA